MYSTEFGSVLYMTLMVKKKITPTVIKGSTVQVISRVRWPRWS
jgi:hypothetical protein